MRLIKKSFVICLFLLLSSTFLLAQEECTTAVVSGSATVDGRPLLWKNRDISVSDNEVAYFSGGTYDAVGVVTAGSNTSIWMGINSEGFALENSLSSDLEGSSSDENGTFMKYALQYCATVDEFEQLLIETNNPGRRTRSNYGVIDAAGAAAIFETGNNTYTKFDANDPGTAPLGFIVRTNFAMTGDGTGAGQTRYDRALELFTEGVSNSEMSHEYILRNISRDLKNDHIDPYPLPYQGSQDGYPEGYIRTDYSINRNRTRSCVVFHGVLPTEDPILSTMWVILGEPVCGIAVPVWVYAGSTPPEMNGTQTAPMCDASIAKKEICYPLGSSSQYIDTYALDNGSGGGIFSYTFQIEDWIFAKTESTLNNWRNLFPASGQVKIFEENIISQAYCCFITSTIPADIINPPLQFTYQKVLNRSLSQAEYLNDLDWQANPNNDGLNITQYRIYQVEGQGKNLLTELNSDTFEYWHRNVEQDESYTYALFAVDGTGQEGDPACTCPTIQGSSEITEGTNVGLTTLPESFHGISEVSDGESATDTPRIITLDLNRSVVANSRKIHKPLNFTGQKILNSPLSQEEFINVLTWKANPKNENIQKYRIYQVEGKNQILLVELNADTSEYWCRDVEKDKQYTYALVAVDDENRESPQTYTATQ